MLTGRRSCRPLREIRTLFVEIWKTFHPAILWWADERAATNPDNAATVYRELLSGPEGAMAYAARLKPLLPAADA